MTETRSPMEKEFRKILRDRLPERQKICAQKCVLEALAELTEKNKKYLPRQVVEDLSGYLFLMSFLGTDANSNSKTAIFYNDSSFYLGVENNTPDVSWVVCRMEPEEVALEWDVILRLLGKSQKAEETEKSIIAPPDCFVFEFTARWAADEYEKEPEKSISVKRAKSFEEAARSLMKTFYLRYENKFSGIRVFFENKWRNLKIAEKLPDGKIFPANYIVTIRGSEWLLELAD